ncbi:MAG TPA: methylmalonyl Co-A mutase-associated GTPase MeaB [Cyclobacteriaceae bacterium]|nr:methylmalonyl Co-A mutase-associated GTPase MeaB [Cyclobacteriaceae bacterium]
MDLKISEQKIVNGNLVVLARAITLCESQKASDKKKADELLQRLLPHTGRSLRVGVTGAPGVGKSTFIEALGKHLTSLGKRIAVLAIDPSSEKTKGSILGDKTRMEELAKDPLAFIRPTATGKTLGGVADHTRDAILLCEAAGFEVILIETVGVGQSETAVRSMVDFFLLLQLAGAGDELQGIKKGIMEMADGIVITKADGENEKKAKQAQTEYQHALHLFQLAESGWQPKVLTTSAVEKKGIEEVWKMIEGFQTFSIKNKFFQRNREQQNLQWFRESVDQLLKSKILKSKAALSKVKSFEKKIAEGKIIPSKAATEIVKSLIK